MHKLRKKGLFMCTNRSNSSNTPRPPKSNGTLTHSAGSSSPRDYYRRNERTTSSTPSKPPVRKSENNR